MRKYYAAVLLIAVLVFNLPGFHAYAESKSTNTGFLQEDKKTTDKDSTWDWDFGWDFGEKNFNILKFEQPTIEIQWGFAKASIHKDKFGGSFENPYSGELHLGYATKKMKFEDQSVIKYKYHYFFVGNVSTDLVSKDNSDSNKIRTNIWRFGFSDNSGYGYNFSPSSDLVLYNGDGVMWSILDFKNNAPDSISQQALDAYGSTVRFGSTWEGGIKFQIASPLSITLGFEGMQIYPRHMFWYWVASSALEAGGQGILSTFTKAVMKASPSAGPVVNFVLKNGLSYAFFELRKKYMNWPIETAPPLTIENFKLGISLGF